MDTGDIHKQTLRESILLKAVEHYAQNSVFPGVAQDALKAFDAIGKEMPMSKNTAKLTDPIWDSRNSDEPAPVVHKDRT